MLPKPKYILDDQVGFLLRKASQRSSEIFNSHMPIELTPTRLAAMSKLYQFGILSQNELGRHTAMDAATIKGVVDRLRKRDLVVSNQDPHDARKHLLELTSLGKTLLENSFDSAHQVSSETLKRLAPDEAENLILLLRKIG